MKISPVTITASWLTQLRKDICAGKETRKGYVFKEASTGSQVKVRLSNSSIALVANRADRYDTLRTYNIHSTEPFKAADNKKALAEGVKQDSASQSRRERAKEANDKKYVRRTYQEWYDEYCELVAIHKDIKRFKDRKNCPAPIIKANFSDSSGMGGRMPSA